MKVFTALALLATTLTLSESVMVCYYGSWAVYRNGKGKFDIEDIDPFVCTHLVFGFAGLGVDNRIKVLDPWNELCDDYGQCGFDRFTALKKLNPELVVTLAVGGWNEGSVKYSAMAKDAAKRQKFIDSTLRLLNKHGFDGLDMDWEYPARRGGVPQDKENFVILMGELQTALHADNKILTAAVSCGKDTIDHAYDVPGFAANVDYIHMMAYDLHGAWDTFTHHHTILYKYPLDEGDMTTLNVDYAVQYWLSLGAPAEKLVLGTATYARCWKLDSTSDTGMYASGSRPGSAGPYTSEPGYLGYNELCEHQLQSEWTIVNEPEMNEPYGYDFSFENTWCGYDNPESLTTKAEYAVANGLAGMMVWSIDTDDFLAECHPRAFHLIKTTRETFQGSPIVTPTPPTTTTRDPSAPTEEHTTVVTYPTSDPSEHCQYPGNNPDPIDCSFYYQCSLDGAGGYTETIVHCGDGALYNPVSFVCDYDYAVCALLDQHPEFCPANCPL